MLGRGIDQILPFPGEAELREPAVDSALRYVALAETANGEIAKPVSFDYPWGDARTELARIRPDARVINLETSITRSSDFWPKGINYRMSPANVPCLIDAEIDCCCLANNHVMDFGVSGLVETLATLRASNLAVAGAGRSLLEAASPAIIDVSGKGRVVVFSFGSTTSGIPQGWSAGRNRPGVNLLSAFSERALDRIAKRIRATKRRGDVIVASIHWGSNWGYCVPAEQQEFARGLIAVAGVDIVHGHSSHHPKAIELYEGKLILYGCGDFINDYEGIGGYEQFRSDLALMYLPEVEASTGRLERLSIVALQRNRFRLVRARHQDITWLCDLLNREAAPDGPQFALTGEGTLELRKR